MANFVKKTTDELNKIERNAKKQKIKNQCRCSHRDDDGELTLMSVVNKNGGTVTAYKCQSCEAIIPIKAPSVNEMNEAIETVLTGLEYYKMGTTAGKPNNINKLSDEDANDRKLIAETMESLISLKTGYEKILNRSQQKNQSRNKRTRRSTTTFMN